MKLGTLTFLLSVLLGLFADHPALAWSASPSTLAEVFSAAALVAVISMLAWVFHHHASSLAADKK